MTMRTFTLTLAAFCTSGVAALIAVGTRHRLSPDVP